MSSDLTFLTNESGKTLCDRFSVILKTDARFFDCLVGYFFISGFYKLYPASVKDLTPMQKLYAAESFRKLAPWEWMDDDRIFGVKNPETVNFQRILSFAIGSIVTENKSEWKIGERFIIIDYSMKKYELPIKIVGIKQDECIMIVTVYPLKQRSEDR